MINHLLGHNYTLYNDNKCIERMQLNNSIDEAIV